VPTLGSHDCSDVGNDFNIRIGKFRILRKANLTRIVREFGHSGLFVEWKRLCVYASPRHHCGHDGDWRELRDNLPNTFRIIVQNNVSVCLGEQVKHMCFVSL
jgi:hypothetical protein